MNKLVRNIVFEEDGILRFWPTDAVNLQPDEVYLARFADKNPIMVDGADIPDDIEYNVSWEISQSRKKIEINIDKAKEVRKSFLRQEREEFFAEADKKLNEAVSKDKDTTKAKERLQYLRNVTDALELKKAKTIKDLKLVNIQEWTDKDVDTWEQDNTLKNEARKQALTLELKRNEDKVAALGAREVEIDDEILGFNPPYTPDDLADRSALRMEKKSNRKEINRLVVINNDIRAELGSSN